MTRVKKHRNSKLHWRIKNITVSILTKRDHADKGKHSYTSKLSLAPYYLGRTPNSQASVTISNKRARGNRGVGLPLSGILRLLRSLSKK